MNCVIRVGVRGGEGVCQNMTNEYNEEGGRREKSFTTV